MRGLLGWLIWLAATGGAFVAAVSALILFTLAWVTLASGGFSEPFAFFALELTVMDVVVAILSSMMAIAVALAVARRFLDDEPASAREP